MRKSTYVLAATAAIAAVGAAATPAMAQNSGVWAGDTSLLNLDASSALHWQICGQNILAQSFGQECDNRDHIDESRWPSGPNSGIHAGETSLANADISDLAHWQVCGQNVGVAPSLAQNCDNRDHTPSDD